MVVCVTKRAEFSAETVHTHARITVFRQNVTESLLVLFLRQTMFITHSPRFNVIQPDSVENAIYYTSVTVFSGVATVFSRYLMAEEGAS